MASLHLLFQNIATSAAEYTQPTFFQQYHWYLLAAISVFAAEGLLIVVLLRTLARCRAAERLLRESSAQFRIVADAAPVLLWMARTDKLCTFFNKWWLNITGRTMEQELGNGWAEGVHADDYDNCMDTYVNAFDRREEFTMEYRLRHASGEYRWVLDTGIPHTSPSGEFLGYVGSAIDITERKMGEDHRDQMSHLARVAMLGELSGSLAHELNQPLTAILSNAEAAQRFLSQEPADLDEVRAILKDIVKDDNRAGEVIQRLRALFRKGELQFNELDINETIREVLKLINSDLLSRNVVVQTELQEGLAAVNADRVQIQQVLLNLVVNGCDAMVNTESANRRLTVRSAASNGEVEVLVIDEGCGIPPERLEEVFTPFFTTKSNGMGLGLAVCRTIVAAHGGRLWATNNNGHRGATFHVTLPRTSAANVS